MLIYSSYIHNLIIRILKNIKLNTKLSPQASYSYCIEYPSRCFLEFSTYFHLSQKGNYEGRIKANASKWFGVPIPFGLGLVPQFHQDHYWLVFSVFKYICAILDPTSSSGQTQSAIVKPTYHIVTLKTSSYVIMKVMFWAKFGFVGIQWRCGESCIIVGSSDAL